MLIYIQAAFVRNHSLIHLQKLQLHIDDKSFKAERAALNLDFSLLEDLRLASQPNVAMKREKKQYYIMMILSRTQGILQTPLHRTFLKI